MVMQNKEEAYKLLSSHAHKTYYDKWAKNYDKEFVREQKYEYPFKIAKVLTSLDGSAYSPIADIGCGTGVLGEVLKELNLDIDGFDISTGMLIEAEKKKVYRNLIECDITDEAQVPSSAYRCIISSGTFTIGHLGPDYLSVVIKMLKNGGLGIIGINKKHFLEANFGNEIRLLEQKGKISQVKIIDEAIYTLDNSSDLSTIPTSNVASILTFNT